MTLYVKVHSTNIMAYIPEYKNSGVSGAELSACESLDIHPGKCKDVQTGVSFTIPTGYEGQVRNVRSMLIKHASILGGLLTINANDQSEIVIPILNHSKKTIQIKLGMPLGQLVFGKIEHAQFERTKL